MLTRRLVVQGAILAFCSAASNGQQSHQPPSSSPVLREFPVVLQQSVEAGKSPAGTKVQGKLAAATLFNGVLIPKNAVASGVVVESESRKGEDRARLAIRMNTVSWNGGWAPLYAYLMPLYYPATGQAVPNLPYESPDPDSRTLNGPNQSSQSPMSRPFAGGGSEANQGAIPDVAILSSRPVRMKNVVLEPASNGGIALVSEHANIKLFKMTTYIFAADESAAR
jgi:hypothetical protein